MSEETETPKQKEGQGKPQKAKPSGGKVLLNEEIEIFLDEERSEFSTPFVKAYKAYNKRDLSTCIAYICDKAYIPRTNAASSYLSILNPNLAKLVGVGIVFWKPEKTQKFAFVYKDSFGKPVIEPGKSPNLSMKADDVLNELIFPMVDALNDLRNADIVHGAIRPSNLFDGGGNGLQDVILGDCLSSPAFSTQPVVYEPIEHGLTDPIARGIGSISDDLYALGATAAMLMCSKDPFEGKSDSDIIKTKMEEGSFVSFVGDQRITGPILEFLRGVLNDNAKERWTIDDAQAWKDGRRLSPKQGARSKKASRPIKFNGQNYLIADVLAMDLDQNPADAAQLIEGGDLQQWLLRSVESKEAVDALEEGINDARQFGRGLGYPDRLLGRTVIALNPHAPLKYKGLSMLPEGVGAALTEAYAKDQNLRSFYDVFNQKMFDFWATRRGDTAYDMVAIINRFQVCRANVRQETLGYGLERCLYFLSPEAPCMSNIFKEYMVRSPEDLLLAFDDMAQKAKPRYFIDRHILAFLSSKEPRIVDEHLTALNSKNPVRQIIAILKIFAAIQRINKVGELPHLAELMAEKLELAYDFFHDRDLRKQLKREVESAKRKGNLTDIVKILDDDELKMSDSRLFKAAMNEYIYLEKERAALDKGLKNKKTFGRVAGQEAAAFASFVLATLMIIGFIAIVTGGNGSGGFLPG